MTLPAAQLYLESFIDHEIHLHQARPSTFKIERAQQLLHGLGDLHKDLKVIHVAGSKGKGSICALTASILQSAGYKVGLYTSPHINNYRERIRILKPKPTSGACLENLCHPEAKSKDLDRRDSSSRLSPFLRMTGGGESQDIFPDCISEEELFRVIDEIKPAIEEVRMREGSGDLSFFEIYTALALVYFHQCKVDFVVLETGLGGRLDATNAVNSIIAVIAPISLEHTGILGNTISKIAQEKAAIIKDSRQKVVIAPQTPEANDILRDRCRAFDIDPLWVDEYAQCKPIAQDIKRQTFNVSCRGTACRAPMVYSLELPLLGKHQRDNAAASVCIAECLQDLGFSLPADAIRKGLKNVFWPGRLEVIGQEPLILLDCAHNPESAKALSETIQEVFKEQKVILVFGTSEDKNKKSIYDELSNITKSIIFTKADHPRAADLAGAVSVNKALDLARRAANSQDIILVTGSIFVVSEARTYLLSRKEACIS